MCIVGSMATSTINVGISIEEARRIGDLNIDLDEIEIIRWRRKVRDAVRKYDKDLASQEQKEFLSGSS